MVYDVSRKPHETYQLCFTKLQIETKGSDWKIWFS